MSWARLALLKLLTKDRKTLIEYLKQNRSEIVDELLKETFVVVDPKDILLVSDTGATFGGKEVPPDKIEQLVNDAVRYKRSFLWQALSRQLRFEASNLIAYKSKNTDDMLGGKMMLYCISVIEDLLDELSGK